MGFVVSGRVLQLNSLENRCFMVELESESPQPFGYAESNIVIKYYRPERYTTEQILEEHKFWKLAVNEGITIAGPWEFDHGTLGKSSAENHRYAIMPRIRGRLLEEIQDFRRLGELVGRLHQLHSQIKFHHRPYIGMKYLTDQIGLLSNIDASQDFIQYSQQLTDLYSPMLEADRVASHGDLHRGNVIVEPNTGAWQLVDFDDCGLHPREQDLWLLLPNIHEPEYEMAKGQLREGYEQFQKLTLDRFGLLRVFRLVLHSAWIGRRCEDESFLRYYPDVMERSFWQQRLLQLKDLVSQLDERHDER